MSEKIDTYETSIQPYEDCCTIFVAKHPVTKAEYRSDSQSQRRNWLRRSMLWFRTAIDTVEVIEVTP